jgi:hypothetical protein
MIYLVRNDVQMLVIVTSICLSGIVNASSAFSKLLGYYLSEGDASMYAFLQRYRSLLDDNCLAKKRKLSRNRPCRPVGL